MPSCFTRGRAGGTGGGAVIPQSDAAPELTPVPVRVVLPADPLLGTEQQEVVARLWKRQQTETGWVYLVGMPSYRDRENAGPYVGSDTALCQGWQQRC